jgi:hypothetical protein
VRWCGSISCCLYRFMLVERPSVCVLASTVDDSVVHSNNNSDFCEDIVTP